MSEYTERLERWRRQVARIAEAGFYRDVGRAKKFVGEHVMPAWRAATCLDTDAEVMARFRVTDAQLLVVHLFVRGVLGVGGELGRARRIVAWPPGGRRGEDGKAVARRVIPTPDIGLMIGRTPRAVRSALARFKGIEGAGEPMVAQRVANVLSFPTGVALDGYLSCGVVVPFMYAVHEYADAQQYAREQHAANTRFAKRQGKWCRDGIYVMGDVVAPRQPANDQGREKEKLG